MPSPYEIRQTGTAVADPYDAPVWGVSPVTTQGRGVIVMATVAGNVDFTFADGSVLSGVPVSVGMNFYPFAVTNAVASASGGATATFFGAK